MIRDKFENAAKSYNTVRAAVLDNKHPVTGEEYIWFNGPYNLNCVIVRWNTPGRTGQSKQTDEYDDLCVFAYEDHKGNRHCKVFPCTAESGLKHLKRKLGVINILGKLIARTAILIPQQQRGMWNFCTARGHKGYPAGRQVTNAYYAADTDYDDYLDLNYTEDQYGNVAIIDRTKIFFDNVLSNLHRAHPFKILARIFGYSAACVVLQRAKDLAEILELIKLQQRYGNGCSVTMTLITRTKLLNYKR